MPILKTNTTRVGYKLLGVQLATRVHAYMSLYALAKGITKAGILKEIIMDWCAQQRTKESDTVLLEQVVLRTQMQWKLLKFSNPKLTISEYKSEVEKELLGKGILSNYVALIIQEIE